MRRTWRRTLGVVGIAGLAALGAGCGSSDSSSSTAANAGTSGGNEKQCIIGWSFGPSDSPTFQELRQFAEPQARERGCELVMGNPAGDPVKQASEIETWVRSRQITALVVLPLADNLRPVLREADDAGIPIVGYSSEQPYGTAAILYNVPALGEQLSSAAIAWTKETFGDDLDDFSYAMITFDQCGPPCKDRTDTIRAAFKDQLGVEPVAEAAGVSPSEGFRIGQAFLQAHPDVKMLLGVGDAVTTGAFKAFQSSKTSPEQLFLGGMDGDQNAIRLIADGTIYRASSALQHSALGRAVVDLPADIIQNGAAENLVIDPVLVDSPKRAAQYLEDEYGK